MWRAAAIALVACSSSTPPAVTPATPPPIANVEPVPAPPPPVPPAPMVHQPCPRSAPAVWTHTVASWHADLCRYIDDAVAKLGPTFTSRASGLRMMIELTMTSTSPVACKLSLDVRQSAKQLATLNAGAKVAGNDISLLQQDCMQALIEDTILHKVAPWVSTNVAPAPSNSTSSSGSATP